MKLRMNKAQRTTPWLTLGLIACVVAILSTAPGIGLAQSAIESIKAPIFGSWRTIRSDAVDNMASVIAYNNVRDEFLVVWEDHYVSEVAIYAQRVDGNGYDLLGGAIQVAHYATYPSVQPAVAYSPAQDKYLVVYSYDSKPTITPFTDYEINGQPVNGDGTITETGFSIDGNSNHQRRPAVAYNSANNEFLVVWDEEQGSGGWLDLWGQRINANDWSFEPGPVCLETGDSLHRSQPDVAYNVTRNQYLVAYTRDSDIFAKVLDAGLSDPLSINEVALIFNTNLQGDVALAAGPDEYLAVWQDGPSTSWRTIYARRVTGAGTAPGPAFLIVEHNNEICAGPDVAFGRGYGYLATWYYDTATTTDTYGRFIMPGSNVPAGDEFPIDPDPGAQVDPAVACNPFGDCLYAESDNSGSADFEINGRMIMPYHTFLSLIKK
jgi:hypothetical protein